MSGSGGTIQIMKLVTNPPNSFETTQRDGLEPPKRVEVQLFEDDTKEILSRNDSPDLPFRWSVNPYQRLFPCLRLLLCPAVS